MKNLSRFLVASLLVVSLSTVNAQDKNNPWQVSFGVNAVDVYPTNQAGQGSWFEDYFNVSDHWNILPSVSTVAVSKYVGDGFSVGARGSLNKITKLGDVSADDLSHYAIDGTVKYNLAELWNGGAKFDPFVEVGGGYTWINEIGAGTLNGGIGINYWFTENLGLSIQSQYKHVFEEYATPVRPAAVAHFQHLAGLSIKFGGTDTDGDGIFDKDDACPEVAGLEAFNGCPDSDSDGIEDSKDACPNEAGIAEFNGCPDTDADGIADKDDACPTVAGLAALAGCPDADGDGVADKDDNCPNEAGPVANQGCPYADKDGDTVLDKDDNCPDVAGTVANNGCPEITEEVTKILSAVGQTVNFNTGKSTITAASKVELDKVVAIIKEYSSYNFAIEGHTDSVGSAKLNQRLSDSRSAAVKDYLVSQGIDASRLTSKGYGEDSPIATNKTRAGRAQNRRVEFKPVQK